MIAPVGIACIYCNHKQREAHTVTNLFASLCAQLASQQLMVSSDLYDLYAKCTGFNKRPALTDLERVLDTESQRFTSVYMFVDALDECTNDDGTQSIFTEAIYKLPATVWIMVTFRP